MDYNFDEYSKEQEPKKYEKSYAWKTAIGLQEVDMLTTSTYLVELANQNISDELSFDEMKVLLNSYYQTQNERKESRVEEADKVALKIAQILSEKSFTFSPVEYMSIHKYLFEDIYVNASKLREYNISKNEWILNGDTVIYGNFLNLKETLEYDFNLEKNFSYKGLPINEVIKHIAKFISALWQIHPFSEGNTRTTAVFLIKYLNKLGFNVTGDTFLDNSWYFRNALVRANYNNYALGISETTRYLELFLKNLLLGESNKLSNKELHINYRSEFYLNESTLSIDESKVLNILINNSSITLEEVAMQINKSLRTVKNIIKNLKDMKVIKRNGGKKEGTWEVLI